MTDSECETMDMLYSVDKVRKILGLGKNKAYDFIAEVYENQSPFPVLKIGNTYRIPKDRFLAYVRGEIESV